LRSLRGVRALVTGASSGIGRVLAQRLARDGARVALVARRESLLHELAQQIAGAGGEAHAIPADLASRGRALPCGGKASAALGGIALLVSNAGYGHHRPFLDWDLAEMEALIGVNTLGALRVTKAVLPQMVARRRGWIVFVASVAGRIATPD